VMKREHRTLGLGTDGDADRFGIMDADGSFLTPNEILPLVLDHLVKTRGWKGTVARSVMTSHWIDAVARKHGLPLVETPVGFKYIAKEMLKGDFVMGGEESGGLTIRGHVPEKDGVLACLLLAEIAAATKKPLKASLKELAKEHGTYATRRVNLHLAVPVMEAIRARLPHLKVSDVPSADVERINDLDGTKILMKDGKSWIGIRLSGTEPVVRLYLESDSKRMLDQLEKIGRKIIQG